MKISLLLVVSLLATIVTGCATYQPLQIEPVRKTAAIAPKFLQSYYFLDMDRNLYFVLRADSTDQPTGKPVTQIATIRVFWHPRGGVTTLNSSALNATFRYLVMTPDAVGMYEGAGFVRLRSKDGAHRFAARVMDADMRLTQASATFNDALGRSHMAGYFTAIYDDARGMDMLLDAQREFFARSLASRPAGAATMPATGPTAADWMTPGAEPRVGPVTAPATMPGNLPVMPLAPRPGVIPP